MKKMTGAAANGVFLSKKQKTTFVVEYFSNYISIA